MNGFAPTFCGLY